MPKSTNFALAYIAYYYEQCTIQKGEICLRPQLQVRVSALTWPVMLSPSLFLQWFHLQLQQEMLIVVMTNFPNKQLHV